VEAAYRALARIYHPDMGGDPKRMMELNEARAAIKASA
jgi:curved DNA-binding protein CbpA